MSSEKKRAANRANARKSTGPRSAGGKRASASNALAHGLCTAAPVLPGEPAAAWVEHRTGVLAALAPDGGLESALAERVAACLWRLRRVVAYETAVTAAAAEEAAEARPADEDADGGFGQPRTDAQRLKRVGRKLTEARERVALWADTAALLDALPGLPDDAPADGSAVEGVLADLSGSPPDDRDPLDVYDHRFLAAVGVPKGYHDDPWGWPGWTAGAVRGSAAAIAASYGVEPSAALAEAAEGRKASQAELAGRVGALEAEEAELAARIARRAARAAVRKSLPDALTLDKLTRYEAHLSRQMLQALNTLERLQAARAGKDVPPPAAGTLVVDLPPALPGAGG